MTILNILNSSYDRDLGTVINFCLDDVEQNEMIIQLAGGEFLRQMGCQISFDEDSDFYTDEEWISELILEAEKAYKMWVEEIKNEESRKGEVWVFHSLFDHSNCSATSSSSMCAEKSNLGRYRVFIDTCGFTQPNDYSQLPDFEAPEYFEDEDEYLKGIS